MGLKEEMQVGDKGRDVIIADRSGRARVSAWEGHVNMMEEKNHYYLNNFMII